MGLVDISLTSAMRTTLFSLQNTSAKVERTQDRLATGKRVNTALDNPTNFFASQAHLNRAADLVGRKDGIMEAIKNGEAASVGLKALVSMIETAKGIANSAHSASPSDRSSLAGQFNQMLNQMDFLAGDSGYRGTNLLKGEDLTVNFNENGSSNLTIKGMDATSSALGILRTHPAGSEYIGSIIAAGPYDLLAIKSDGTLDSWTGFTDIPKSAKSDVVSVVTGSLHALALKADETVVGWGDNSLGQTNIPTSAQTEVIAIATGNAFSLALKSDGSVVGWGQDTSGETTPPLSAQSDVVAIAAGGRSAMALKNDGSVVAWGDNTDGQTSVPLGALSDVVGISMGNTHALALKSDGSVIAWGSNSLGETTVPPEANSGVVAIAAGWQYSMALKNDGSVIAWGPFGSAAVPAAAQSDVVAIAAGYSGDSLATKSDGSVIYWNNSIFSTQIAYTGVVTNSTWSPFSWSTDADISKSEQQLETAMNTLRTNAATMSSTLSVIGVRKEFTDTMVANLETGADNQTLADMNEEGANMLMLQTRQNLGITSLSMAGESAQAVLKLF